MKLGSWDVSISWALLRVTCTLIDLPPEDLHCDTDTEPTRGKLNRSVRGTQGASRIFRQIGIKFLQVMVLKLEPFVLQRSNTRAETCGAWNMVTVS